MGKIRPMIFVLLLFLLILSVFYTVGVGSVKIDIKTVYSIIFKQILSGDALISDFWTKGQFHIVWDIRIPRVLMGVFAGAGLALCGAVMQSIVLNPIADPYILGVSSGASAGAALALLVPLSFFSGIYQVSVFAFIGASIASFLVYYLSRLGYSNRIHPVSLLLAGIAVNAVMSAVTSLLIFLAKSPESIATVYYWQMGSIASAQRGTLLLPFLGVLISAVFFIVHASQLNILMMGDDEAQAIGVNVNMLRTKMMIAVTFCVAIMVSVTGVIGFVGLMIPHIVRMIMHSSDNRIILPACILCGAIFMIWADAAARSMFGVAEIPLGIITAFTGAPFFIFLLYKQRMAGRKGI